MQRFIQAFKDMAEQLNAVHVGTGDAAIAEVLKAARVAYGEAQNRVPQQAEALHSIVQAIDDASAVADPDENESRAYENELESAIGLRNEFDADVIALKGTPSFLEAQRT